MPRQTLTSNCSIINRRATTKCTVIRFCNFANRSQESIPKAHHETYNLRHKQYNDFFLGFETKFEKRFRYSLVEMMLGPTWEKMLGEK